MTDIAIVGIDCRFPGANNPAELWDLLMTGGDGVTEVPPERWRASDFYDPDGGPDATNTTSAGFIADPDVFDHEFFGLSTAEAAMSDPQVRLLLHSAWRALEDACLDPRAQAKSKTGVFVGIMNSDWMSLVMTDFPALNKYVGSGVGYSMAANRISYELDLTGPSMAIDTFCSSSLVATQHACTSLRTGESDQALVGGVNLIVTPASGIFITQAGLSAPDGRCKPFSAEANGFGRAEGVGVVVLRRLEDALADGLPIYAVIRDGAVNHGGRASTPTAPNARAQRDVLVQAYERARVRPQDITFMEAHATGTLVGDRIEAWALAGVHGVPRDQPCAIGSIKGNISHAEGAAGVAGLIKTALALHHGVVPPSRYADSENPRLRLAQNGLRLLAEPMKLPDGDVLAGVSSFGLGGTNAHLVLASAPQTGAAPARRSPGLLTVSSNNVDGLRTAVRRLAADLAAHPVERVGQLSWTTNQVKASGTVRFALPIDDPVRALETLESATADEARLDELSGDRAAVTTVWVLPGVGAEFPGMSSKLHECCPPYRLALDTVDEAMRPRLGGSVRELLFAEDESIHRPDRSGPALFAVGYALGLTLRELGVVPAGLLGRGVGEWARAALAGELDLAEACRRVTADDPEWPAEPENVTAAMGLAGKQAPTHVLELGPGPTLAPAVAETLGARVGPPLVPRAEHEATGAELLEVVAALYRDGFDPVWEALYEPTERILHRLSPYEFATSARFWTNRTVSGRAIGSTS